MHWETWYAGGSRAGGTWTRYLPDDALLRVCPACHVAMNAKDAVELRCDKRSVLENYLIHGGVVVVGLFVIYALPLLLSNFVCH
jgi:hypothetical protein